MKKVGFIDYYLNEWHADNYPEWIFNQSGGEFKVCYAYGKIEPPFDNALSNAEWAKNHGIELLSTIKDVVDKSDCIVVLSPDNSEMHFELSEYALKSGKPVFIDKTFTDDKETAEKIFEIAKENKTPVFSSSALRFSEKLQSTDNNGIDRIISIGCGEPAMYIIHQLEPIAVLMGTEIDKVMCIKTSFYSWILHFTDGRTATVNLAKGSPYTLKIIRQNVTDELIIDDDFFKGLIDNMLEMFKTGNEPIAPQDTINIMATREACIKAMDTPEIWIEV